MNAFDSKLLDGKTKLHFVGIGGSGMFPRWCRSCMKWAMRSQART